MAHKTTATWTNEAGYQENYCGTCGERVTTHPDDCAGGLGYCGDCNGITCAACREDSSAGRCPACSAKKHETTATRIGKRQQVIVGYAALARFLSHAAPDFLGEIPREVATPYAYSQTHMVYAWHGQPVIIAETAHRRYEVFPVTGVVEPLNTF
jgi:hypothetical protein